jgi:hypothetical protein
MKVLIDRKDRYERLLIHLEHKKYGDMTEHILQQGLGLYFDINSRLKPNQFTRYRLAELYAKHNKIGFWADGRLQQQSSNQYQGRLDGIGLVAGKITHAKMVGRSLRLNFGENWRQDFTIMLKPSALKHPDFKSMKSNIDFPANLIGKIIEARGWIRRYNGPYMEIISRHHIELLP